MIHLIRTQELLNITTGNLHTDMLHVYKFFRNVTNTEISTFNIAKAFSAIRPILKEKTSLPFEGYHPEMENEIIALEFDQADIMRFLNNMSQVK